MSVYTSPSIASFKALIESDGLPLDDITKAPQNALRIGIINLMPTRMETERQWCRLFSSVPKPIALHWIETSRKSKHTEEGYTQKHYTKLKDLDYQAFDAFVLTGAPVEHMPFESVDYWQELATFYKHATLYEKPILSVCWGAQALLYLGYGIQKHLNEGKIFGVFPHVSSIHVSMPWFPHSRYTTWRDAEVANDKSLKVLIHSEGIGPFLIADQRHCWFVSGHMEYDKETLLKEYHRDMDKGMATVFPKGMDISSWHEDSIRVIENWIIQWGVK